MLVNIPKAWIPSRRDFTKVLTLITDEISECTCAKERERLRLLKLKLNNIFEALEFSLEP